MGTSISFQSPNTPRWRALQGALDSDAPVARIRSELFNAATESWQQAVASEAIQVYARAIETAYAGIAESLASGTMPVQAMQEAVAEARRASLDVGFSPALAIAERSFLAVIAGGTSGEVSTLDATPEQAAQSWQDFRGDSAAHLVKAFAGELFGQLSLHVVARDTPGMVGIERMPDVSAARDLGVRVSADARDVVSGIAEDAFASARWASVVSDAFGSARALPEPGDG